MKKIKVKRQSGLPVKVENAKNFMEEWKFEYDKIKDENKHLTAKELQPLYNELEDELYAKYPRTEEWDPIEDWSKVIEEYSPILVTKIDDSDELAYLILDQGL